MEWPLVIEVPLEVVSGNKFLRGSDFRRLGAYKSLREQWCWGITIKLGAPKLHRLQKWVRENRPRMRVQFTCYRRRRIEPDNLMEGLKPVRDCLVMPKRSHPSGLGLIVDDSQEWLVEAPPKQELVGKGMRSYTVISLEPVE